MKFFKVIVRIINFGMGNKRNKIFENGKERKRRRKVTEANRKWEEEDAFLE